MSILDISGHFYNSKRDTFKIRPEKSVKSLNSILNAATTSRQQHPIQVTPFMFRIAIEEFGSLKSDASKVEFALEWREAHSVRELLQQIVTLEWEQRGLELNEKKLASCKNDAIKAFERGTFAMFVDGEQIHDIEHILPAERDLDIVFIRILPLVGG